MSNKAKDNVVVRNIYYMMAYAFRALDMGQHEKLASEEFENVDDLLAAVLVLGTSQQRKRGLERDYVETSEDVLGVKGRVDMAATARNAMAGSPRAHCRFDEFSEDTLKNQILKACALSLLRSPDVAPERKRDLKRCALALSEMSDVDPKNIQWRRLGYHQNNAGYMLLMNVCYIVLNDELLTEEDGEHALASYMSDRKLSALYEQFVLAYYVRHHPWLKVSAKEIPGCVSDDAPSFLPRMLSDITLENEASGKTLIIDTKCYGRILKMNFGSETVSSANRYQIYSYVMHEAYAHPGSEVQGMLLYALTKDEEALHASWEETGHRFHCLTLNLELEFSEIAMQLDSIAEMVR